MACRFCTDLQSFRVLPVPISLKKTLQKVYTLRNCHRVHLSNSWTLSSWFGNSWMSIGKRVGKNSIYRLVPILTFLIFDFWKLNLLGSFCSCMAAGLGAVSLSSKEWDQTYWLTPDYGRLFADPWIELHASIAIFSYGIFALLSIVSAMYLIQRKSLLARKVGFSGSFLPAIHDLEQAAHKLLLIGTLS